ncbi:hypothetical protein H9657_10280 [Cellulomonas sp. Sa3CUA2]|uniref:DUF916 domain-containing protein n=1 Tax=Cellulomonas avistercoris TaxID=2762242 RepID=A0ABR8QE17_9CELL|nr:hypothetical protein [Cellulomonas avistercoris]
MGALALLVALLALVGPTGPASAATTEPDPAPTGTVTWTVQPATAEGPDGRISLRHVLDPGATVTEHVTVTNFSERAATFLVYAADGMVSGSGDFDVPGAGATADGGAWVELGEVPGAQRVDGTLELTLDAGAAVTVPLTITVPADATPGDHPAGVVAELVSGDDVRLAARVGTRLHLRVAGDVVAALEPQDVVTRWEPSWNPFAPGTVHVSYRVANTGDVRLAARAVTTLAGPFGAGATEDATDVREVLPGQSALVEAELEMWPVVRATGHVDARPWVVGDDVVDAALRTGTAQVTVWAVPWSQLALLVLVVGGVLGVRWWRRRSARQVQARIDAALAEAGVPGASSDAAGPRTPVA